MLHVFVALSPWPMDDQHYLPPPDNAIGVSVRFVPLKQAAEPIIARHTGKAPQQQPIKQVRPNKPPLPTLKTQPIGIVGGEKPSPAKPALREASRLIVNSLAFLQKDIKQQSDLQRKFGERMQDRFLQGSISEGKFDSNAPLPDSRAYNELSAVKNHGNGVCSAMAQVKGKYGFVGIKMWRCKPKPLFKEMKD